MKAKEIDNQIRILNSKQFPWLFSSNKNTFFNAD